MQMHHEVPTHLDVEDKVLLGLSVRQFLYLLVGSSAGYTLWDQAVGLSDGPRAAVAAVRVGIALAFGLLRPAGRPLEDWLVAALVYMGSSKRSTWRPPEPDPSDWYPSSGEWQALRPSLDWVEGDDPCA